MVTSFCCFVLGDELQLQVDDKHILWADGDQISTGSKWNQIYSVNRDSYYMLAIYAENSQVSRCHVSMVQLKSVINIQTFIFTLFHS